MVEQWERKPDHWYSRTFLQLLSKAMSLYLCQTQRNNPRGSNIINLVKFTLETEMTPDAELRHNVTVENYKIVFSW